MLRATLSGTQICHLDLTLYICFFIPYFDQFEIHVSDTWAPLLLSENAPVLSCLGIGIGVFV